MFNRRLAVTFVKDKNADDSPVNTTTLNEIGDIVVNTTAGVGLVVVTVASVLTALRVTELAAKYILR